MAEKIKPELFKHLPKKENVSEPVSEPQQTPEVTDTQDAVQPTVEQVKPQGVNWDVMGVSSAAVTLLGAGFLFMVGWAYVSSWYSYFGINIEALSIPIQEFLIYSFPAVSLTISFLLLSFSMYYLLKFVAVRWFPHYMTNAFLIASFNDWIGIIIIYLLACMFVFYLVPLGLDSRTKLMTTGFMQGFSTTVLGIAAVIAALSFARKTYTLRPIIEQFYRQIMSILSSSWVLIFPFMIVLFSTMSLSARLAINYAYQGENWVTGSKIQRVTLVSPQPLYFLNKLEISCDATNHCMYGPLGLIADTQLSFYLVNWWELDGKARFPQNPGVYIIPRTDVVGSYFLVPVPILFPLPTPQFTPTVSITTTPIIIATLTPNQP